MKAKITIQPNTNTDFSDDGILIVYNSLFGLPWVWKDDIRNLTRSYTYTHSHSIPCYQIIHQILSDPDWFFKARNSGMNIPLINYEYFGAVTFQILFQRIVVGLATKFSKGLIKHPYNCREHIKKSFNIRFKLLCPKENKYLLMSGAKCFFEAMSVYNKHRIESYRTFLLRAVSYPKEGWDVRVKSEEQRINEFYLFLTIISELFKEFDLI